MAKIPFSCLAGLFLLLSCTWAQDGPVVDTTYGPVQGSTFNVAPYDVQVNSFHAIPYGRPPVDDLRFAVM